MPPVLREALGVMSFQSASDPIFVITGMLTLLFALTSKSVQWFLSGKVLVWFGSISYGLYLIHTPVMSVLKRIVPDMHGLFLFALTLSVASFCAYLSLRFFEKPVSARIRRLADPRKVRG